MWSDRVDRDDEPQRVAEMNLNGKSKYPNLLSAVYCTVVVKFGLESCYITRASSKRYRPSIQVHAADSDICRIQLFLSAHNK